MMHVAVYKCAFAAMPVGLVVINSKNEIVAWNPWMKTKTGYTEEEVLGSTLESLYPNINYSRFNWACEQIFNFGAPQVMSQILNNYLIPIPVEKDKYEDFDYMQQHVEILPLEQESGWLALVVIQDVTNTVHQKNLLMKMARKLEEESYHDALTNTYNRRFLWEYLNQKISQSHRSGSTIACLLLDLDHFKKINDRYGHKAGDSVLLAFVALINKLIRSSDVFVRYGGEEFIIIVPDASQADAEGLSNRIRCAFEKEKLRIVDNEVVTCSIGVSFWSKGNEVDARTLVEQSDKAMYLAKNSGRNCLRVYTI